jgi:DegV family protein with EDD domain
MVQTEAPKFNLTADSGIAEKKYPGVSIVDILIFYDGEDITKGGSPLLLSRLSEQRSDSTGRLILPETKAPGVDAFKKIYEASPRPTLSIHIGSDISNGTVNSANAASTYFPEGRVVVFDTETVSAAGAFFIEKALESTNRSPQEVAEDLERMKDRVVLFGSLDTMDYLAHGGRAKEAVLAGLSSIGMDKLGIRVEGNKIKFDHAAPDRYGFLGSLNRIAKRVKNLGDIEKIVIAHADAADDAERMANLLYKNRPERIAIEDLGPVMISHAGPKALAIAVLTAER